MLILHCERDAPVEVEQLLHLGTVLEPEASGVERGGDLALIGGEGVVDALGEDARGYAANLLLLQFGGEWRWAVRP